MINIPKMYKKIYFTALKLAEKETIFNEHTVERFNYHYTEMIKLFNEYIKNYKNKEE